MNGDTLVLAHYYTIPEVQQMADFVGDSLELAQRAKDSDAKRIVFAGVRFMAETTKMLNPKAEVILPSAEASCSLVDQTGDFALQVWVQGHKSEAEKQGKEFSHVMYINSSVRMKALADIIVTSRNVDDVVKAELDAGKYVIFSPDRNMGAYLNYTYGYDIPVWNAVCDVHDKFKEEEIEAMLLSFGDEPKFLLAHPESPLPVLKKADVVGSTSKMLQWVADYPRDESIRAHVVVATEDGLLYNMREARPDLDIVQAPTYTGCQCNSCPFMKQNTVQLVQDSIDGKAGVEIDYLTEYDIEQAITPVNRMLDFK